MEIVYDLISRIAKKKVVSLGDFDDLKEQNPHIYYFFSFLKKGGNIVLFIKIYDNINSILTNYFNKYINKSLKLNGEEYCKLHAIFIMKSLKKSNFEILKEIKNNITIDNVIDSHISFEKKFWIFEKKELYPYCNHFKREIFRVYSVLSIKNVIEEKILNDGIKSYKQWILEYDEFEINEIEKFRISFTPFKVYQFGDRFFLMSTFFVLTTEVFKENIHSSKRFKLKERAYLQKLCETFLIFDEENFNMIYSRKLKELDNIDERIRSHITQMKATQEKIEKLKHFSKQLYISDIKKIIIEDIKLMGEINEFIPFKVYMFDWLSKNFPQIGWDLSKINLIWRNVIEEIVTYDKKQISGEWMNAIMKRKSLKIHEILSHNQVLEVKKTITDEEIEDFIYANFKKLVEIYKNLNFTRTGGNEYSKNMLEVRKMLMKRADEQSELFKLYFLNNLKLLNSIKKNIRNKKLYFPLFYDFRGRIYVHSAIGITNFTPSRFFFHYGWYNDDEIKELSKTSLPEIQAFKDKLDVVFQQFNITRNDACLYDAIFWCIIAIGKEFIDKTKVYSTLDSIFESGFSKLFHENNEKDDEKWIIVEHYRNIISSLKNKKIPKKLIHKDATASFIQNTIRIVGAKNRESLEYANLKSRDKWYDTYALALEFWKNTLKINNNFIEIDGRNVNVANLNYFVRKTIKKPIMTDSYEATYMSQWEYFRTEVKREFKVDLTYGDEVEILFKNFIKFLDKIFWNEYFLAENSDTMVNYIINLIKEKKETIISSFDSESNIIYYKFKNKTIDVIVKVPGDEKTYRKTKLIRIIDENEINLKKLKNAVKPNWVHFSDAYLIRQINTMFKAHFLTVHDCFLVDSLNVSNFITKANKAFKTLDSFSIAKNKNLLNEVNSIFIFF